jgi:Holliday junction DNA helicase RuvA
MFNSLRGIISGKKTEAVFLLSGDIEWEITMPSSDIQGMALNSECRIFTWLYHREDQMKLYGFADERRRVTFLELLKVEGIGPKGAVKILGGIAQEELERALEAGDLSRLEAVPGLGKKTAQKMLLALKGKLVQLKGFDDQAGAYGDLAEALASMGYDRRASNEALAKADAAISADIQADEREKLLFKEAIVYLSGS